MDLVVRVPKSSPAVESSRVGSRVTTLLLNIHTLFFFLTFSFFILLHVLFIVSFVSKLSFIFPLALLIVILLSIFWYSWIVYFLCIYFLFRYFSNPSHETFRSKFRLWIFCNVLLSKVFFSLYPSWSSIVLITSNSEISSSSIISLLILYHEESISFSL